VIKTIFAAAVAGMVLAASPISTQLLQAQDTKAEPTKKPAVTKATRPVSPGQAAARERQKKCGAEWKEAKASGKRQKGMTWPKFWSACNKRLKGG
jgi:hypothetical protein